MNKITLIHTVKPLMNLFESRLKENIQGIEINHIYDDYIVKSITKNGGFSGDDYSRLLNLLKLAESSDCDVILVTCSSLSIAIDRVRKHIRKPIYRIDEPMMNEAVKGFSNITVVATAESTLKPSEDQILSVAEKSNKKVLVDCHLVKEALGHMKNGNMKEHDILVSNYVKSLENKEVIILAQGSMGHLAYELNKVCKAKILSSTDTAIKFIEELFKKED